MRYLIITSPSFPLGTAYLYLCTRTRPLISFLSIPLLEKNYVAIPRRVFVSNQGISHAK